MKCAKEKKEGQLIRSTSVLVPLNKKRTSSQLSSEKENCLAADIGCYVLFEVISRCFERKGNPNGAASSEFSSSQIKDSGVDRAVTQMISGDLLFDLISLTFRLHLAVDFYSDFFFSVHVL